MSIVRNLIKIYSLNYRVILLISLLKIIFADQCREIQLHEESNYHRIKRHFRSEKTILSRKQLSTVQQCKEFSIAKKGLAFNYYYSNSTSLDIDQFNCQVLACPEQESYASLVKDKYFNYYSIYPRKIMPVNESALCLPSIGMFVFFEKPENYSNAQSSCAKIGSKLAHIVSHERSEGLGKFLFNKTTFVGLSNREKERDWKNEFGTSLMCFDYRGWAKGEPTHSRGCVALFSTKFGNYFHGFWKVVPCSENLPYICEILPTLQKKKKKKKRPKHS